MSLLLDLVREKKISTLVKTALAKISSKKNVPAKWEDGSCFFVLSTGRVGTKTLAAILESSPDILSFHEPSPKLYAISKKSFKFDNEQTREILSTVFLLIRERHIKLSVFHNRKYIETGPQCTFLAPAIKKALPNTRFLHLLRNPEKVIKSGMNRGWYSGHSHDKYRILPHKESSFYRKWGDFSPLEKNVWLWSETNNWISNYLSGLKAGEKLMLQSENLFGNDKTTLQKLFNFLGIDEVKKKNISNILSKKLNNNTTSEIDHLNLKGIDNELSDYYELVKKEMGF